MEIIDVLKAQNEWWKAEKVPSILLEETKRDEFDKIIELIEDRRIISIIGPRRTGKTTLMYQLIAFLLKDLEPVKILFFSMDDPALRQSESLFEDILKTYFEDILKRTRRKEKIYIFIDEIHFLDDWERWLKKYYDMAYPIKFIISSSSSAHLSKKSRESLVGRIFEILLLPLNFRDYLSILGKRDILKHYGNRFDKIKPEERFELLKYEEDCKLLFNRYLLYGGLPESIKEESMLIWQSKLISDVLRKVLYRDVVELYNVRIPSKLEDLFVHLSVNSSNTFSYSSISRNLGMSIEAVINYIGYLKEAYLIGELRLFSKSVEKTLRSNRKYFIMDSGLQNSITKTTDLTEINAGLLIESVVQKHLWIFAWKKNFNIYYWKDKGEVDIVLDMRKRLLPVEVKYRTKIGKKELKGILKFMEKFKVKEGIVVTKDLLKKETFKDKEILFVPAWLFLLGGV